MYDAILILGGGVREGGNLPPWVTARFNHALSLWSGEPLVCLSAGTTHRPPPLENGFPIAESVAGARYLIERGVPPERIRIENMSYDTIGNAYLTKLIHVDPPAWRKLLMVTSAFHMPRTREIFEWVYGFETGRYELSFQAAPDEGIPASRQEKEQSALNSFRQLKPTITSLAALHEWFFTQHKAYAAAPARVQPGQPALIDSY